MTSEWHYAVNGEKKGPVTEPELQEMLGSGALPSDTMVWKKGMSAWAVAPTIEGLVPVAVDDGPPPLPDSGPPKLPAVHEPEGEVYCPRPLYSEFTVDILRYPWDCSHNFPAWLLSKWGAELDAICESFRLRFSNSNYLMGNDKEFVKNQPAIYKGLAIPPEEKLVAHYLDGILVGKSGIAFTPIAIYWRLNRGFTTLGPYRLPYTTLVQGLPKCDGNGPYYGFENGSLDEKRVNFANRDGEALNDLLNELAKRFTLACGLTPA